MRKHVQSSLLYRHHYSVSEHRWSAACKVSDVVWVVYEYRDTGVSVTVEDDWGRLDASENAGVVPGSVYQPSVPDKRAYRRGIYTNADLSSASQIFLYCAATSSWGVITQMPRLLWLVRTRTTDITFIHVIPHQLLETKAKHIWRFETTERGNCWTSTMCASISSQWQQFSIPSSFPAFHFIPIFRTDLLFSVFLLSRNFLLHWPSRILQTEGLNDELSREKQVFLWLYIWVFVPFSI